MRLRLKPQKAGGSRFLSSLHRTHTYGERRNCGLPVPISQEVTAWHQIKKNSLSGIFSPNVWTSDPGRR